MVAINIRNNARKVELMADSRDKPDLETLSYRKEECSTKPSSAPMGFNSAVIKPETRVNKAEDAEQPPKQSKDKNCKYAKSDMTPCYLRDGKMALLAAGVCVGCSHSVQYLEQPEQPNQNLMIIEEIEGLISQANEKMYDLPIHPARSMAIEEIDILLRITVRKQLREAFE